METKVVLKDPSELSIHPAAKPMPEWAKDDKRFIGLVEDIRARGIDQPLLIDKEDRIVDGRHRWRGAKQLQLPQVICRVVSEEEASSVILNTLIQRRHFTKGALAYLAYPLLEEAHKEAQRRRLEVLRKGNTSPSSIQSTTGKTVEEFAQNLGFGRDTFYQAQKIHELFNKNPKLRQEFEQEILDGEIGLGACIAGIAGQLATKNQAKRTSEQLDLFIDSFDTLQKRFTYWGKFSEKQREELVPVIRKTVAQMPADLREELTKALNAAAKEKKQNA